MREETGEDARQSIGFTRSRAISDAVDAADAEKLRAQIVEYQQHANKSMRAADSANSYSSTEAPEVDSRLVREAVAVPLPEWPSLVVDVLKEVVSNAASQGRIQEPDERSRTPLV